MTPFDRPMSFWRVLPSAAWVVMLAACGGEANDAAPGTTADASADRAPAADVVNTESSSGDGRTGTGDERATASDGSGGTIDGAADAANDLVEDRAVAVHDADPDADIVNPTCNDLVNTAPTIEEVNVPGDIGTPMGGGQLYDGLYYETEFASYTGADAAADAGPNGVLHRFTALLSGTHIDVAYYDTDDKREHRLSGTLMPNGTSVVWTFLCPMSMGPITYGYDADASHIRLYPSATPTHAFVLTRQ